MFCGLVCNWPLKEFPQNVIVGHAKWHLEILRYIAMEIVWRVDVAADGVEELFVSALTHSWCQCVIIHIVAELAISSLW